MGFWDIDEPPEDPKERVEEILGETKVYVAVETIVSVVIVVIVVLLMIGACVMGALG